jgi:two-component system NarL family sensor kinase
VKPGFPQTRLVVAISTLGLVGCAAWFSTVADQNLTAPLTALLVVTAVLASLTLVDLDDALFLGGSLIANVCAIALLGPAGAALVALAGEIAVISVDRYRVSAFPMNLLGGVLPNMVGAAAVSSLMAGESGLGYYAGVFGLAWVSIILNGIVVTSLVALERGDRLLPRLRSLRRLLAPVGLNVVVAVGAVAVYRNDGFDGVVFVVAALLVFAYSSKQLAIQQRQVARISALAEGRGRLVAQTLEAEDRERRALAEVLHDHVIQPLLVLRQDLVEVHSSSHLLASIDSAVAQLRQAIRATHPSILNRIGLEAAIGAVADYHAEHAGIAISLVVDAGLPSSCEPLLFSSAREFVLNAVRHSDADAISIVVRHNEREASVTVLDDGIGWDLVEVEMLLAGGHFGLASLIDRIEAVGGCLMVSRRSDARGTAAVARFPIERQNPAVEPDAVPA